MRDPKLRPLPLEVVDYAGARKYDHRHKQKYWQVVPSQSPNVRVDAGDQSCCASWRMSCLGKMHDNQGDSGSQTCCKPLESWIWVVCQVELKDGRNNDTD